MVSGAAREEDALLADRYRILGTIGAGGMATVELGELVGPVGFSRLVAIKRLHPKYSSDANLVTMFVDEARLAARVRHPNVVSTLDVVKTDVELCLVLDYVHGESLARLLRAGGPIRPGIASAIVLGLLHGLHAAHEAEGPGGVKLEIIHRDVSPENVLVGVDGIPRLADFGVAKARHRLRTTLDGSVRGKLPYMAPEQLEGGGRSMIDRRTDVYAASVLLWELLVGRVPLEDADLVPLLSGKPRPDIAPPGAGPLLDAVVMKGLAPSPADRHASALEMAIALERAQPPASQRVVAEWVRDVGGEALRERAALAHTLESSPRLRADRSSNPRAIGIPTAPQTDGTLPPNDTLPPKSGRAPMATIPDGPQSLARAVQARAAQMHVSDAPPSSLAPTAQPSSEPPPPARRRKLPIAIAAIGILAVLGAAAFVVQGFGVKTTAASVEPSTLTQSAPPPITTIEPAPVVATAKPAAEPVPSPPLPTAKPAPQAHPVKPAPKESAAKKRSAPGPRGTNLASCEVPFRVDEDGVRIPKPGCF